MFLGTAASLFSFGSQDIAAKRIYFPPSCYKVGSSVRPVILRPIWCHLSGAHGGGSESHQSQTQPMQTLWLQDEQLRSKRTIWSLLSLTSEKEWSFAV